MTTIVLRAKDTDRNFVVGRICEVRDFGGVSEIKIENGWTFGLDKKYRRLPKPGDAVTLYYRGHGSSVYGVDLNGEELFYRNPSEDREQRSRESTDWMKAQESASLLRLSEIDRRMAKLPDLFKRRLQVFLKNNASFAVQFALDELDVAEEAIKLAAKLSAEKADIQLDPDEVRKYLGRTPRLRDSYDGDWDVVGWLARLYLRLPDLVPVWHSVWCPLVGCRTVGCGAAFSIRNALSSILEEMDHE